MPRTGSSKLGRAEPGGVVRALAPVQVPWKEICLLALLVASLCLFGIWSRPGGLASLWLTNAFVLGIFVRAPFLARLPSTWAFVAATYIAVDLATGSDLQKSIWLNAANLTGIAVGMVAFSRLRSIDKRLGRPPSIVFIFFAAAAASAGTALVGMGANVQVFGGSAAEGFEIWFTAELSTFMAILPLILSAPAWPRRFSGDWVRTTVIALKPALFPALALAACFAAWGLFEDPAVLALPIPVLLWTALRAGVFATAALTLVAISWTMLMVGDGALEPLEIGTSGSGIAVFQICLSLLAMGPIAVASSVENDRRTLVNLWLKANQDEMTGALSRQAFFERAETTSVELAEARRPVAVAMLDLDRFKQVNDDYGHAAGDAVLCSFGQKVQGVLRDTDLFGRIGGEEFAVVLPGISPAMSLIVIERIRSCAEEDLVDLGAVRLNYTVSIGLIHSTDSARDFDSYLRDADRALYQAKNEGRNRVIQS